MPELTTVELVSGFVGFTVVSCLLKLITAAMPTITEIAKPKRAISVWAGQLNVSPGKKLLNVTIKIAAMKTCTTGMIFKSMISRNVIKKLPAYVVHSGTRRK
jgi:hypothetical protein